MNHIIFVLISISYCVSFISLATLLIAYKFNRNRLMVYFTLFMVVLTAQQIHNTFIEYVATNLILSKGFLYAEINYILLSLMFFTLPLLCHELLDVSWPLLRNIVFGSLSVLTIGFVEYSRIFILPRLHLLRYGVFQQIPLTYTVFIYIKLAIYIYLLALFALRLRKLTQENHKKLAMFAAFFMLMWPLTEIQPFIRTYPMSLLPGATLFFVWNLFLIWYTIKYFMPRKNQFEPHSLDEVIGQYNISEREKEIIEHVIHGLSNKDIARELHISESTVKTHIINIYRKLGVNKRVELMMFMKSGEDYQRNRKTH